MITDIKPTTPRAYQLIHEGMLALTEATRYGICVDVPYCKKQKKRLKSKIKIHKKKFFKCKMGKIWKKEYKNPNLNSGPQLRNILYDKLGAEVVKTTTKSGSASTDKETLNLLLKDIPELKHLLETRRYKKGFDVLDGFLKEQVNGVIHPTFATHTTNTFRSCIAGYEKVFVVRDFLKHPQGVPIKDIKVGDLVYCFDDDLNPKIKPVTWQGKTGHREVLRVHYYRKGKKGHFDCTPEHKVRLINGEYVEAQDLLKKQHYKKKTKNEANCRVLACSRSKDRLNFTGHIKKGSGIPEHRFIYENLIDKLKKSEVVHHKNREHLDHSPNNLEKMTLKEHSKLHIKDNLNTEKSRKRNRIVVKRNHRKGKYKHIYVTGKENHSSLNLTKKECLNMLHSCKGFIKTTTDTHHIDFSTFKKYLKKHNIDWKNIKLQYDINGKFISKKRLKLLSRKGRAHVQKKLGFGYSRLLKLYNLYNIDSKRKWGNQYGEFKPGNHVITKIEWLNKKEDVYDIEVKDCHNFFVNEICVHNSSYDPNFQNIPTRDPEIKKICRRAIKPRPGNMLVEYDFSGIEVCISCCVHKDPKMINYVKFPEKNNMHTDMAIQIFMLDKFSKEGSEKILRSITKNGYVFPQFYGDYYINCAKNLATGAELPTNGSFNKKDGLKLMTGINLGQHLINKGIYNYGDFVDHIKDIENDFWKNRFKKYGKWKKSNVKKFNKLGYLKTLSGFTCSSGKSTLMNEKEINNYPIQGPAFHCNLKTFVKVNEIIKRRKLKSRLIGQIHDSIIFDAIPKELEEITEIVRWVACEWLPKQWKWIIVPLEVEGTIFKPDANWASKDTDEVILRAA